MDKHKYRHNTESRHESKATWFRAVGDVPLVLTCLGQYDTRRGSCPPLAALVSLPRVRLRLWVSWGWLAEVGRQEERI